MSLALPTAGALVLAALAASPARPDPAPDLPRDPRSIVLLDEDCRSALDHRELTLFANGTVRLRQGAPGSERMSLLELPPPELETYVRQLGELDWSETERAEEAPSGEWTEICRLEISLEGRPTIGIRYDRYSTGSLALDGARRLVNNLIEKAQRDAETLEIPSTYKPMVGDRLMRNDGLVFEIVGFTSDGHGVELDGVELPLTIYVEKSRMREVFRRLVPRPGEP